MEYKGIPVVKITADEFTELFPNQVWFVLGGNLKSCDGFLKGCTRIYHASDCIYFGLD